MDMSSEQNHIVQADVCASAGNGKLRVIVVDDDALFCEVLTAELEEHGFSVTVFGHGQALLRNPDIAVDTDVIVLDWNPSAGQSLLNPSQASATSPSASSRTAPTPDASPCRKAKGPARPKSCGPLQELALELPGQIDKLTC